MKNPLGKIVGKDRRGKELHIGDTVLIEQCWEDTAGHYHDEFLEISKILNDGRLQFRIGNWKTRKQKDQKLQAFINSMEYYPQDVELETA